MGGPGGLEAGVPGAGVAVGQRTSCLDVAQHLLLVLLRPHLQGMGDELRGRGQQPGRTRHGLLPSMGIPSLPQSP